MRKMIIAAVAVFCAGILLGGIGTGVAIVEYTELEYTGEHVIGDGKMKTETMDLSVSPEEGRLIRLQRNHWGSGEVYDESVPENTIRYVITYNPELVELRPSYEDYEREYGMEETDGRYQGRVYLTLYSKDNEMDIFMRNKDRILEELKNGKIGSYKMQSVDSVEVRMNPQMKEFVELW